MPPTEMSASPPAGLFGRLSRKTIFAWGGLLLLEGFTWAVLNALKSGFTSTADEATLGRWAAMLLHGGIAPPPMLGGELHYLSAWGRAFPLDNSLYQGPWAFYAMVPFLLVSRDPWAALRLHAFVWSLGAAAASYWMIGEIAGWDSPLPLACGLALASSPYFVDATLSGAMLGGTPAVALGALTLGLLHRAARGSTPSWLLGCLAAGLACAFVPQGAAVLLAWLGSVLWMRRDLKKMTDDRTVLIASIALLAVGPAPILMSNALFGWYGAPILMSGLSKTSCSVVNANYAGNLWTRLLQIEQLLGFRRSPRAWAFLAVAVAGLRLAGARRAPAGGRIHFLWIAAACIIFVSPFTLGGLRWQHLLILLPLALALAAAAPRPLGRNAGLILSLALLPMVAGNLRDLALPVPGGTVPAYRRLTTDFDLGVLLDRTLQEHPKRLLLLGSVVADGLEYRLLWNGAPARPEVTENACRNEASLRRAVDGWFASGSGLVIFDWTCPRSPAKELLSLSARRHGAVLEDVTRTFFGEPPSKVAVYRATVPERVARLP